uniref:Uncharacterized protein n=1 Tax=Arundo donax TaxID=35708 RepID=A0A0A9AGZ7_ARUDO
MCALKLCKLWPL